MADRAVSLAAPATGVPVPPPRRRRVPAVLGLHAVPLITLLGLPPLAASVVALAGLSQRRLPARTGPRGRRRVYSDASVLLVALLGRLWQLSTREVCAWLARWPALAATGGLPPGRVLHPAHLSRRARQLGVYPVWLLCLALVWRALQAGLVLGRDVVIDATLLAAWTKRDPDAGRSFPSAKGRVRGYKVHTLLERAERLPLFFLLSPANRNDLPFAYPLLRCARCVLGPPIRLVRADGAY
jgi:hypothetical protein